MRNSLKIGFIIILVLIFTGCAKRQINTIHIPELNKMATVEVGNNMYEKVYGIVVVSKFVNFQGKEYKFAKVDDAQCAIHNGSESLLDYNCDGYFTHKRGSFGDREKEKNKLEQPIKYDVITRNKYYPMRNSFKYEVIYQGKVGSQIKIAYREFYSDIKTNLFMIRPAFEQSIDYELAQEGTTIIGFKGLRIEVIKATNMNIAYKVVKDYD